MQLQIRGAALRVLAHLKVQPADAVAPDAGAQGFGGGLLGRKLARQGFEPAAALRHLGGRKHARQKALPMAIDCFANALDFDEVHAGS